MPFSVICVLKLHCFCTIQGTPLSQMTLRTALCRRLSPDSKVISSYVPSCSVQVVNVSVNFLSRSCCRSFMILQNVCRSCCRSYTTIQNPCHHSATTTVTSSAQRPFQYWFPRGICACTFSTFSPGRSRCICLFPLAFAGGALRLMSPPSSSLLCRPLFSPDFTTSTHHFVVIYRSSASGLAPK